MRHLLGILALVVSLVLAKNDAPTVEETKFESVPTNLFYFEDSDVVLITDSSTKTTYRSEDAGFKWEIGRAHV